MSVTAFLTDSTLCIGCKACEVACKEWNGVSEDGLDWSGYSYDNTGAVGHSTWRHVKFVEQAPIPGFGGNANRGVRAMLSGPSGTGKTFAARILADLGHALADPDGDARRVGGAIARGAAEACGNVEVTGADVLRSIVGSGIDGLTAYELASH